MVEGYLLGQIERGIESLARMVAIARPGRERGDIQQFVEHEREIAPIEKFRFHGPQLSGPAFPSLAEVETGPAVTKE